MSKPIYLPHSARQKYEVCPRMYQIYYQERLRTEELNSTLMFGTAIDGAAEEYLNTKNRLAAVHKFKSLWNSQEQDGKTLQIYGSTEVKFSPADLDVELVHESHHKSIIEDTSFETLSDFVSVYKDQEVVKNDAEKAAWAKLNWWSLYYKAKYMLTGFMDWADENIEEILGTQLDIDLEDEEGNKVPGKADFVMKIKGYDKPILVDLKTSARYYERSSVRESEQLALYYFYLQQTKFPDMERAAYLVLSKQIKKNRKKTCLKCGHVTTGREHTCAEGGKGKSRCNGDFSVDISPEAVVQYIHDEIPTGFIQDTINKFNVCVEGIKAGRFEPCWTACDNQYGRPCPYKNYCLTGDLTGLKKKEKVR